MNSFSLRVETPHFMMLVLKVLLMFKLLISSGRVDPMSKNNHEQGPMDKNNHEQGPMELVPQDHKNRFEILKMFKPFLQSQGDFPVESYGKVFMCGDTASGKSSLTAVIMERAKKPADHNFDASKSVAVEPLTAGIEPHTFTSHEIGNVVLYDLTGHVKLTCCVFDPFQAY